VEFDKKNEHGNRVSTRYDAFNENGSQFYEQAKGLLLPILHEIHKGASMYALVREWIAFYDEDGGGQLRRHGDTFLDVLILRSWLSLGTSKEGKKMRFREICENGRSLIMNVPHETLITLDYHASGADGTADMGNTMLSKNVSYVTHEVPDAPEAGGTSSFFFETNPQSGLKADNIRILLGIHSTSFLLQGLPNVKYSSACAPNIQHKNRFMRMRMSAFTGPDFGKTA
jgi:hypothetical protein